MPGEFLDKIEGIQNQPKGSEEKVAEVKSDVSPKVDPPAQSVEPPAKAEPPTPQVPPGYIPIAAQLDERDKRQKAERDLEALQRKFDEQNAKAEKLDPLLDPDGYERSINDRINAATWHAITSTTRMMAVRQYGEEAVKAAEGWLKGEIESNPAFFQTIRQQADPYDFVVRSHKRSLILSKFGDKEPEAWAKEWAEANGYSLTPKEGQTPPVAAAPVQQPPAPKPSIAAAASAANATPKVQVGNGVAFDRLFK